MDSRCISREEYVFFAKLSELAERYDEMARFMEKVVVLASPSSGDLTAEERNLLSVAYKNLVGGCRAGWRILSHIEQREEGRKDKGHAAFAKTYRGRVESDLASICDRILGLLDSHLIPSAGSSEAKVFYLKMKGDYNRYIAEYKTGAERQEAANCAMAAYQAAQDIALSEIPPSNPLRLGVALNYSVFYFEILHSADDACATARQAFYAAVRELDSLGEESNKDSALIVQLLRENLNLWSSAGAQEQIDEA